MANSRARCGGTTNISESRLADAMLMALLAAHRPEQFDRHACGSAQTEMPSGP